ncbi:hypothetical protein [Marinobacter sp.]|uniref:hypothetical protein n=1 Tax=Marinobacter sp. TaxID=50741 RepID=UPI003BAB9F47
MSSEQVMTEEQFRSKQHMAKVLAVFSSANLGAIAFLVLAGCGVGLIFQWGDLSDGLVYTTAGTVGYLVLAFWAMSLKMQVEQEKARRSIGALITAKGTQFKAKEADKFGFHEKNRNAIAFDRDSGAIVVRIGSAEPKLVEPRYFRGWRHEWTEVSDNRGHVKTRNHFVALELDDIDHPRVNIGAANAREGQRIEGLLDIFVNGSV